MSSNQLYSQEKGEVMKVTRVFGDLRKWAAMMAVVVGMVFFVTGFALANSKQALLEAEGLFQRAKLLMKKRAFSKAALPLKKIIKMKLNGEKKAMLIKAGSHMLLVDVLYRGKKYDEGLKTGLAALKKPVFKRPSRFKAELYKLIGKLYEKKGNVDKAIEYNDRYLKMQSKRKKT